MSLNYNVQEHLIIDLDRAGAAGSAVWEALVEQVRICWTRTRYASIGWSCGRMESRCP